MQSLIPFMLAGALLGTGLAVAQSPTEEAPQDKPGYLAKFNDHFKAADKDADGALTRSEVEGAGMSRVLDNFERLDADRDGKITRTELRALVRQRLSS